MTTNTTTTRRPASKKRLVWLTLKLAFLAYFAFFVLKAIGSSIGAGL